MTSKNSWHNSVPNAEEFDQERASGVRAQAEDTTLRKSGLEILMKASTYGFGYKNKWLGVPIIRLPEDIMVQQEIIWTIKPDLVIEVGVARGGGLILNASLLELAEADVRVVGVDNKIFEHTRVAIANSRFSSGISLIEGDSVSSEVLEQVSRFTRHSKKTLLILDSDHSEDHVFRELSAYAPLLPSGSVIIVCDTLIDELPAKTYRNRSWSNGKGPLAAIKKYLDQNNDLGWYAQDLTRSLILSEIRDGILIKH